MNSYNDLDEDVELDLHASCRELAMGFACLTPGWQPPDTGGREPPWRRAIVDRQTIDVVTANVGSISTLEGGYRSNIRRNQEHATGDPTGSRSVVSSE